MKIIAAAALAALLLAAPASAAPFTAKDAIHQAPSDKKCDAAFKARDAASVFNFCRDAATQYERMGADPAYTMHAHTIAYAMAGTCLYQVAVAAVATQNDELAQAVSARAVIDLGIALKDQDIPDDIRARLQQNMEALQQVAKPTQVQ
jgi:uncharacterized protein (UPF0147 family)